MLFQDVTDFDCALRRRFRAGVKDQPHAVTCRNLNQATGGFGFPILIRTADNFGQLVNHRPLFVNRKLGVTNDVDEQDVRDLKLDLFLNLSGHKPRRKGSRAKGESPMDSRTSSTTRILHRYRTARTMLSRFFLHHCIGLKSSPLSLPILAHPHKSIEASASKFASKRQWKSWC